MSQLLDSPFRPGRLIRTLPGGIICAAGLAFLVITIVTDLQSGAQHADYNVYYTSAFALRHNLDPYQIDINRFGARFGFWPSALERAPDTPTFILCFEPLTVLGPVSAYWVWFAIQVLALAAALLVLVGPPGALGAKDRIAVALFALAYPPIANNFLFAQTQILVLLALALAMRLLEERHDAGAGLVLALAALLRAYPLALAGYLVAGRRWNAMAWLIVGLAVGGGLTLLAVGSNVCLSFLHGVGLAPGSNWFSIPRQLADSAANLSFSDFIGRALDRTLGTHQHGMLDSARRLLVLGFDLVLVALAFGVGSDDRDNRGFSLWTATMVMLMPVVWIHYLVVMLIPLVQIAKAGAIQRTSRRVVRAGLWSYALIFLFSPALFFVAARIGSVPAFAIAEAGFPVMASGYLASLPFALNSGGSSEHPEP